MNRLCNSKGYTLYIAFRWFVSRVLRQALLAALTLSRVYTSPVARAAGCTLYAVRLAAAPRSHAIYYSVHSSTLRAVPTATCKHTAHVLSSYSR